MQLLTHALAGWCIGNLVATSPNERLGCIAISCAPDVDALSLMWGTDAYRRLHHVLTHNLPFAVCASAALTRLTQGRLKVFCLYLLLFHLHLLMDLFGSGATWGIAYLWPLSSRYFAVSEAWDLRSWQNLVLLGVSLVWTIWIAARFQRTPLEVIAPRLDALLLDRLALKPNNRWRGR
jgi:inner membrane protein